ncbi:MAG: hypothetical protein K0Q66_251 [Chitinophagaceae bacterium]|jgi:hypothetical protein|nr:hypothetical protein [Chitinophagaceae bacterium]
MNSILIVSLIVLLAFGLMLFFVISERIDRKELEEQLKQAYNQPNTLNEEAISA